MQGQYLLVQMDLSVGEKRVLMDSGQMLQIALLQMDFIFLIVFRAPLSGKLMGQVCWWFIRIWMQIMKEHSC